MADDSCLEPKTAKLRLQNPSSLKERERMGSRVENPFKDMNPRNQVPALSMPLICYVRYMGDGSLRPSVLLSQE